MKSNEIGVSYKIRCFRLCLDFIKKIIILSTLRTTWFTFTITIWRKHKFTRTFRCLHFFVFFFFVYFFTAVCSWLSQFIIFFFCFFSLAREFWKKVSQDVCAVAVDLIAPGFVTVYTKLSIQFLLQSFAFEAMYREQNTHSLFFSRSSFSIFSQRLKYTIVTTYLENARWICVTITSSSKTQLATEFHRLNCTVWKKREKQFKTYTPKQTRFFQCPIWKITQLRLKCTNSKQWAQILRVLFCDKDGNRIESGKTKIRHMAK